MRIGLQLYTVRDAAEKDFVGTLERIAAMGYQGVEFAGYGGLTPEELKATLSRLGLAVAGSHVGLDQLTDNLEMHIEMNKAVGNDRLICPYLPKELFDTEEALSETIRQLQQASERLAAHGMKLGYHNHHFEFLTTYGNKTMEEIIFSSTSTDELFCELDVCWVQYSGNQPVEWVKSFAGRLPLVHLKDLRRTEEGEPLTVELGQGELDLRAVAEAAQAAGAEWLIVEQDFTQRDALESVEASLQWAKEHLQGIIS
ncbi:sugar phosphate isomerase/epimerase family protein [Paenibacillus marinisediminis]